MRLIFLCAVAALAAVAVGDVYMHNPRGCNNKLNDNQQNTRNQNRLFDSQNNRKGGYAWGPTMTYYEGSVLSVEWTNQHGCGSGNAYCQIILQYMCADTAPLLRDGDPAQGDEARETYDRDESDQSEVNRERGRHEPAEFYTECEERERNKGLWIADQNVCDNRGARCTRQNNNGERHGLECPEERDYYPYWHPTPWRDIAVMTHNLTMCGYYAENSQNTRNKGHCANPIFNNQEACEGDQSVWTEDGRFGTDPPVCIGAPFSRDNHLGNGLNGHPNMFNWTLPDFPGRPTEQDEDCVLRLRYNISTADFDPWTIDHTSNGDDSPLREDDADTYDIGMSHTVNLAINTDQIGRVFQDRSQIFKLRKRGTDIPVGCGRGIYNLNVRGRRGNIEQTFPAVEYDFVPNVLEVPVGACVHVQWTGSDFNAANQAGEGTDRTDRSNLVPIIDNDLSQNYPEHIDNIEMFDRGVFNRRDFASLVTNLAMLGGESPVLNDAPAHFDAGVLQFTNSGEWNYMCTRNNNFTNRSQKGTLIVARRLSPGVLIAIWVAGGLTFFAGVFAIGASMAKKNPTSAMAQFYGNLGRKADKGEDLPTAQPTWTVERRD